MTRYAACSSIPIAADAMVQDGSVKRVDFFQNGLLVKVDTRAPYEITWENVPDGLYSITAKATDQNSAEAFSDPVLLFVGNVRDGNLIANGEFNCGVWPWRLDAYEGAKATLTLVPDAWLTEDTSAVRIEIQEIGNQVWGVQLMQTFKLRAGHSYEVRFTAQAEAEKAIQLTFSQDYDPWAPLWTQDVTVSSLDTYGPYVFDCTVDDPKIMFKFILGGNLIPISIDAVEVIDKQWTGLNQSPEATPGPDWLYQNFPNPFNSETAIRYFLGTPGTARLSVVDVLGRTIVTTTKIQPAGYHLFRWDGRDRRGIRVPSGLYVYRLQAGTTVQSRKMLVLP
jgi:hypothetical protein